MPVPWYSYEYMTAHSARPLSMSVQKNRLPLSSPTIVLRIRAAKRLSSSAPGPLAIWMTYCCVAMSLGKTRESQFVAARA